MGRLAPMAAAGTHSRTSDASTLINQTALWQCDARAPGPSASRASEVLFLGGTMPAAHEDAALRPGLEGQALRRARAFINQWTGFQALHSQAEYGASLVRRPAGFVSNTPRDTFVG